MPFDQWYDDATREAATARVLQRRMTNPTDRNVLTVVAEEFNVPRQTLADWVDEASPGSATPQRKPRPKFSQVVRTTKEARVEPPADDDVDDDVDETLTPVEGAVEGGQAEPPAPAASDEPVAVPAEPAPEHDPALAPAAPPVPVPVPAPAPPAAVPADHRTTALEAEVAALRAGNRALVEALRVLIDD